MKSGKKLVSTVLLLSMLVSQMSSPVWAAEVTPRTITTDRELVFDPLAEPASVAYERHEDGYVVSLDRGADNVAMNISAVPSEEDQRAAEKARLYIRTGVRPEPGVTYQVSFILSAERDQTEYGVGFDGETENAYGFLEGQSVEAGGTDRVTYLLTPEADEGELVLRLLLGKTGPEGNLFRFSDLTVEQAGQTEPTIGTSAVLADDLNYNAPGSITMWASDDSKATLTTGEGEATLTVTQAPTNGAEVWKIKLLVATGLKPEAGKAYRIRADLKASTGGEYEICYNEGDVEKGYDVLYAQKLTGKKQTLDRTIYVPRDKESAGEMVLQLSLGKLPTGATVTINNIRVEEAIPHYQDVLPANFAFDFTDTQQYIEVDTVVAGATAVPTTISWDGSASATASGDKAGALTVSGGAATLEINGGSNVWDARLNLDAGTSVTADTIYRVSFKIRSTAAYSNYEILYGTALNGVDNNQTYGSLKGRSLAANTEDTVTYSFTPDVDGGLLVSLQLGAVGGGDATVTVSDLKLEEMTPETTGTNIADVAYPSDIGSNPGSFSVGKTAPCDGTISAGTSGAILTCTGGSDEVWKRKLFVNDVCSLTAGKGYEVSVDVEASADTPYEICYNKDGEEKGYGAQYGLTAGTTKSTVTYTVLAGEDGSLNLQLNLGQAEEGTTVTVGNITVKEISLTPGTTGTDIANVTYPSDIGGSNGNFSVRSDGNFGGAITGNGTSATMTCTGGDAGDGNMWQRGMFTGDIANLVSGESYQVSFQISATADTSFEVCYNKNGDWDANEKAYGWQGGLTATSTPTTVTHTVTATDDSSLRLRIDLGRAAEGVEVTVSDIQVREMAPGTDIASVSYPTAGGSSGNFSVRSDGGFGGTITGNETSATMTCTGGDAGDGNMWQRGMFTGDIANLVSGKSYQVSFQISATADTSFEVCYNKNGDWDANEKAYGWQGGLTATSTPTTVTHTVTATDDSSLRLRIDLGRAAEGVEVTVSDIQVREMAPGTDIASVSYPTASGSNPGSFSVGKNGPCDGTISAGTSGAILTCTGGPGEAWQRKLFVNNVCSLTAGKGYEVSVDVEASAETPYEICYNKDDAEKGYGAQYGLTAGTTKGTVTYTVLAGEDGSLSLQLNLGQAAEGTKVTVGNITVKEIPLTLGTDIANVTYPSDIGGNNGDFSVGKTDPCDGTISAGTSGAILTCTGGSDEVWKRKLFVNDVCSLTAGKGYEVSVDVEASAETPYEICYNKDGEEKGYGAQYGLTAGTTKGTVTYTVLAGEDGTLNLQLNLGQAAEGTTVTVGNITVKEISLTPGTSTEISFGSVWTEQYEGFTATLTRNSNDVVMAVTKPAGTDPANWKAKLCIRTGVVYEAGKSYRVSFDIEATQDQREFCVITKGVSDSEDIRGTWGQTLTAGQKKTITTRPIPAGMGSGALDIDIELGNLNGDSNTFTVSNVRVEEVTLDSVERTTEQRTIGTADYNLQDGYRGTLTREEESATLNILETPAAGMEPWKSKMFIDTGVRAVSDEVYRVTFDLLAERDMDFEICYNRDDNEKGYDAIYGLHAVAGTVKTVEKVFAARVGGKIKVQLSLGNVPATNAVTVSNVRVERVTYTYSGRNALPTPLRFTAPSDVTRWVHGDYDTALSGTDDAITMNILKAPEIGAEPWKIKLFVDTGVTLQAGRFYKVSADLLAEADQNIEICYNNGGVEMGYDSMGGLRLLAGETKTVDKIIAVPGDKTDTGNLMLQFNLGNTTAANRVTVSGIKVREVPVTYVEQMPQTFAYRADQTVQLWTDEGNTAVLGSMDGQATLHVTGVPEGGAEVWQVKLFVKTGVILMPGRTYQVHANLAATNAQNYEVCYNNEETEKGYDVLYSQFLPAGTPVAVDKEITVPTDMTDAGELILQFSVGGPARNDFVVSGVSVREMDIGESSGEDAAPHTVVNLIQNPGTAAGALDVTRERLSYQMTKISPERDENAIDVFGANLRKGERYTVEFKASADKPMTGLFALLQDDRLAAELYEQFDLTPTEITYSFTTHDPIVKGGAYDLLWQFGSPENQQLGEARVEISDIKVYSESETLTIQRSRQHVEVNGQEVFPSAYAINGHNYMKLRDLAVLLNGTDAQFVVRYNPGRNVVSLTTGKEYTPIGGELVLGEDMSATCMRSAQDIEVNGKAVQLKAYSIGGNNYFKLRDLDHILGFTVDYDPVTDTVLIKSPMTPEKQEAAHHYQFFFRPEIDGESQPYVGDPMPYYEDGTYYIYYLKEGGDSYNHSVYLTTTTDFVHYTELDDPVLSASREDVQDNWIGTGSVVKVEGVYYFFYTGFNASGSQEYHEKIMVAKSDNLTSFEKVAGWEIVPPVELGQKNDFRDPQAYYDPETQTISLTVTASQGGAARILKYTLGKDLRSVNYDGIIFTDPTGRYWNLECSDTFQIGDKWYLTYSGQEDTLWYAMADSRFGPYSEPVRLDGKLFYAAKHVENGSNTYMVGWARRSESPSSTQEVSGWAGNLVVQQLRQQADGSLTLVPVDSIVTAFNAQSGSALQGPDTSLTSNASYTFAQAFTSSKSFMLRGEFTYTGSGSFGLAFDFNGKEDQYKLISIDPATNKLSLSFNKGRSPITETKVELQPNQAYSFTYIQDGSVGIFYLDGQAALVVRLYGVTDKPIYLFAENNNVTFTDLWQYTR